MADIFGLGSHRLPNVFFGPLQARGMEIGMATIAVGFLLLIRYKRIKNHKAAARNSNEGKNRGEEILTDKEQDTISVCQDPLIT